MAQGFTKPGVVYSPIDAAANPQASGGGAYDHSYTGSDAAVLDCSALAGYLVELRAYVQSDGSQAAAPYRFCWISEDEYNGGSPSVSFPSGDIAASLNPESEKCPGFFGVSTAPVTQLVSADRPYLLYQPMASVSTAESILVSVAEPAPLPNPV